jgi:hypothetical protein
LSFIIIIIIIIPLFTSVIIIIIIPIIIVKEYMRMVAPIKGEWLTEIAPHYYQNKDVEDPSNKKMPKNNTGKAAE